MVMVAEGIHASVNVAKSGATSSSQLSAVLFRLLVVNAVALYAGAASLLHALKDVPIQHTWMMGVLGCLILFVAVGVLIHGRPLGFFVGAQQHRLSVDWLPILLIWPMGLSLWTCLALGLASAQSKQDLLNGVALPLMLLAAAVPPLFLGRVPFWPQIVKPWQRIADALYAVATMVVAVILFISMNQALQADSSAPNGVTPASTPTASSGFVCNPDVTPANQDDDDAEDNRCPAPPAIAPVPSSPAAPVMAPSSRPIDQQLSLHWATLLLACGLLLAVARLLSARGVSGGGSLLAQVAELAEKQVVEHAADLLQASGVPGAGALTEMATKALSSVAAAPAGESAAAANPLLSAMAGQAVPPVAGEAASAPASMMPSMPAAMTGMMKAASTMLGAAMPGGQAPSPQSPGVAAVSGSDANEKLVKQEALTAQLQNQLGDTQGKLATQTQLLNQVMADAQKNAEESQRTIDSLTRLMQSMKADVDRLSRGQSGG